MNAEMEALGRAHGKRKFKVLLPSLVRRCFHRAPTCRTSPNTLWACSVCRRWYQRNCSASQKISEWLWGRDTTPLSRLSLSPANERRIKSVRVVGVRMCIRCRTEANVKGVHLYVLVVGGNRHKLRQPLAEPHGHVTVHVHSKRFKAFLQATDGEVLEGADVLTKVHSGNLTNTQTAHWDKTWRWTSSVESSDVKIQRDKPEQYVKVIPNLGYRAQLNTKTISIIWKAVIRFAEEGREDWLIIENHPCVQNDMKQPVGF